MSRRLLSPFQNLRDHVLYDLKLQYKLIIAFSIIMLFPLLLLGFTATRLVQSTLENSERSALLQSMSQLNSAADYYLSSYLNAGTMVARNHELQQALNQRTDTLVDAIAGRQQVNQVVSQIQAGLAMSGDPALVSAQNKVTVRFYVKNEAFASYLGDVLPLSDVMDEVWFVRVYSTTTTPIWQSRVLLNGQPNIVLNQKVTDLRTFVPLGVMRVFIPVSVLKDFVDRNMPSSVYRYFYVDDQYRDILNNDLGNGAAGYSSSQDQILEAIKNRRFTANVNTMKLDQREYSVGVIRSSINGWRFIFVAPIDSITASTRMVSSVALASAILALALCIVISVLISRFFTSRLDVLVHKTNQVDKGNFAIAQSIRGSDEIGQLDMNFNHMVVRVEKLIQNDFRAQFIISKVKLELLQEQINPHLLYNTLSLISMISKRQGCPDVFDVTQSLIAFYKGILNRGKIITSIREEMATVMHYIDIMRTVYSLDIDCIIEIDDCIYDYYIIKLLLQPVVENAILHGLRPKGGGRIFISGVVTDSGLEFAVTDDGVGMTEEVSHYLNSLRDLDQSDSNAGGSYGLSNVIKRVDLFWGREYGVYVESTPEIGTTVLMRIPRLSETEIRSRLESTSLS